MSQIIYYAPSQGQKHEARTHSLNFNLVHDGANHGELIHIVWFKRESFSFWSWFRSTLQRITSELNELILAVHVLMI